MSIWTSCYNLWCVLVYCQGMFHDLRSPSSIQVDVSPIPIFFHLHHWALQCLDRIATSKLFTDMVLHPLIILTAIFAFIMLSWLLVLVALVPEGQDTPVSIWTLSSLPFTYSASYFSKQEHGWHILLKYLSHSVRYFCECKTHCPNSGLWPLLHMQCNCIVSCGGDTVHLKAWVSGMHCWDYAHSTGGKCAFCGPPSCSG